MCLGGGGGGSTSTTTTSTSKPPKYLLNMLSSGTYNPATGLYEPTVNKQGEVKNPLGINQEAYNYYQTYQDLTPEQQALITGQRQVLEGRDYNNYFDLANSILSGNYNVGTFNMPDIVYNWLQPQANVIGQQVAQQSPIYGQQVSPQAALLARIVAQQAPIYGEDVFTSDVNLAEEMAKLGTSDPSVAINKILSGQIDNPYLAGMLQSYINQSMQGYNDTLLNTLQSVLPGLRTNAVIGGTYGGSREGMAEGLIDQQLLQNIRDLSQSAMGYGTNLYGTAYTNAQDRMAALASQLAQQAQTLGLSNEERALAAQEFNSQMAMNAAQFNAQLAQALGISNADRGFATDQFNAQLAQALGISNADRALAAAEFNAQLAQALGINNADRALTADQFNAQLAQALGITNAGMDLQAQLANADNALAEQQQLSADQRQNLATQLAGLSTQQMGWAGQDELYNQIMSLLMAPQNQQLNTLQALAGTILPQASPAYVQTQNSTSTTGGGGSDVLGGAMQLAGLIASLFAMA